MLFEVLRAAVAVAFLFVLPGYFITYAIFPRRGEIGVPMRAFLTVVLSASAVILVGALLGFLPHGESRGMFQTIATGFPFLEAGLLVVTAGAAVVAYERDAFPRARAWIESHRGEEGDGAPSGPGQARASDAPR